MVLIFSHNSFAGHATPEGHPERAERHRAVLSGLASCPGPWREAPLADEADLLRCHPARHVARIRAAVPATGFRALDADTILSPGTWEAAVRAVGGACAAVDAVMAEGGRAFVACRPPGHHAETATAMGFCLFGTVAIAARRALQVHGLARVAVLDFDVHHGNGTQDLLWDEPGAMFVSSHQMPMFPGTGAASERGAHGQIVNLPLRAGTGGDAMRAVWGPALARVADFGPDLILVSAGFDAHCDDPLGGLAWDVADFAWLTRAICGLADRVCGGRVVSCLEGGYDLAALTASVAAHLAEMGRPVDDR